MHMDTTITMRSTKAEMLAHIKQLELRLAEGGRTANELRHKLSVAQGALALKRPTVEHSGQRTIKRWPAGSPPPWAQPR